MNITAQLSSLPLATVVNPPTDDLRRENNLREVISPPAAANQSTAEKVVGGDKDKGRTAAQINDQVDFSNRQKQAKSQSTTVNDKQQKTNEQQSKNSDQTQTDPTKNNSNLSEKDKAQQNESQRKAQAQELAIKQQIISLQKRDQQVRAHESAHATVGGETTGAPTFSFKKGPDGKNYAVSGEVSVDSSPIAGKPRATITKMLKVHAAALAPVDPSAQDRSVAVQATKNIVTAQSELLKNAIEPQTDSTTKGVSNVGNSTLKGQKQNTTSRSAEVQQRAKRIESFYSKINQANETTVNVQLQLTA